jgi:seryl-tRNA synthetase
MLDIKFIRENKEKVKKAIEDKGIKLDLDELLKFDEKRRDFITKIDSLRSERNKVAKERNVEKGKAIKVKLESLESESREAEKKYSELMLFVPNIPASDTPVGSDSKSNKEIRTWGEIPQFNFPIKNHIELGENLGILDLTAGSKTAGFRGYYLKNEGALLSWAILNFALQKIISHGFVPMVPPTSVHEFVLIGSGHFPFGKQDVFQIANPGKMESGEEIKNPIYLAGTSEPSLLAYF